MVLISFASAGTNITEKRLEIIFFLTHKKQAYDVANRLQHENAEMDIIYVLFSLFGYFKVVF